VNARRAIVAACALAAAPSCAPPTAKPLARPFEPQWEDVLDARPDLLVVVRPRALELDAVYGPLLRRALAVAKQRYRIVSETRALDAVESSDEVIVALRSGPTGLELVFVERGVRADVDPARLVDTEGRALWQPGPSGSVRELERSAAPANSESSGLPDEDVDASLFELPGRTWVIATGPARARARQVFQHPTRRPAPDVDAEALVVARVDGPSLVARVPPLRPGEGLDAIGRGLVWADFELPPGAPVAPTEQPPRRTWRAILSYADGQTASAAESQARDVVGAFARTKPEGLAWLGEATVSRAPGASSDVVLTAPLSAPLIERLLRLGERSPQENAGGEAPR